MAATSGETWLWYKFEDRQKNPFGWKLSTLLANEILGSVVDQTIHPSPWRIHNSKHTVVTLRFMCFIDRNRHQDVLDWISNHPLLMELSQLGVVHSPEQIPAGPPTDTSITCGSDAKWPHEIQETWIYFLHGASKMWLELVREVAKGVPIQGSNAKSQLDRYDMIHRRVSGLWSRSGSHAFLHHIHALFGYEPFLTALSDPAGNLVCQGLCGNINGPAK